MNALCCYDLPRCWGWGMARFDGIAVYMMANRWRTVVYIGVTSDLVTRVWQHRNGEGSAFTRKYRCHHLVWFEQHSDMSVAIQRETSLKRYLRKWKDELIAAENPQWRDLWEDIKPGVERGVTPVTAEDLRLGRVADPAVRPVE
jgi:putative endonuclease